MLAVSLLLGCSGSRGSSAPAKSESPTDEAGAAQAAILAASNLPDEVLAPLDNDGMKATVHRLSNGMTVYISTDREKPEVTTLIPVRTGSRNDPAASTGLAHYLEHMLFKGTDELGTIDIEAEQPLIDEIAALYAELRTVGDDAEARAVILEKIDKATIASAAYSVPNEISRLYGQLGIEGLNAWTWLDETVYVATVPSNRLDAWLRVEKERFSDPVFRLFYPELEAVYEEKNISLDSPGRRVNTAMMEMLFPEHPYGTQPTIGLVEHLKTPAYQDMEAYFERWYAPNNMAVVLAGDIDAATALPLLEATLGQIPARTVGTPEPAKITPLAQRTARVVEAEGATEVTLAWPTVPVGHEDWAALSVMDLLVDDGSVGALNLSLTTPQRVARAYSSPSFMKEAGWWTMGATAKEGQTVEELEGLLLEVVTTIKEGRFTDADLKTVLLGYEMRQQTELEFNFRRANRMADAFLNGRAWSDVSEDDERVLAVTREDVLRVANRYLGDAFAVVQRVPGKPTLPKIDKPSISAVPLDPTRTSPFAEDVMAMEAPMLTPRWLEAGRDYTRQDGDSGPFVAVKNTRNGLFSATYMFELGDRTTPGLCFSLELAQRSGTANATNEALKKEIAALGGSMGISCGNNVTRVNVTGLDRNLEAINTLAREWIDNVVIDARALKTAKATLLSRRKDNLASPNFLGYALAQYASVGGQSSTLQEPSNRAIEKLSRKKVEKLVRGLFDHQRRVHYFGPRDADAVRGVFVDAGDFRATERRPPIRYREAERPVVYFMHRDVAKSSVYIYAPTQPGDAGARASADLWGEYLSGGMGGLIFQEVREARGLAYSAYAYLSTGLYPDDQWALVGSLGTQSDKTIDALTLMLSLLQEHAFDPTSVGVAKTSIEASYGTDRVSPRGIADRVHRWERRGETSDPRPREREAIQAVELAELQAYADGLNGASVPVIAILGNRDNLDLEGLARFGKVVEVAPSDVVSW